MERRVACGEPSATLRLFLDTEALEHPPGSAGLRSNNGGKPTHRPHKYHLVLRTARPEGRKKYSKTAPLPFDAFAPVLAWWSGGVTAAKTRRREKCRPTTLLEPSYITRVRKKLALDQRQAAELFGGGVNAFSRYENGRTRPPLALVKLFKLLGKHPERLSEVR